MENSNRRRFMKQVGVLGVAAALLDTPGLFAETLTATPEQTEGPYYPTTLPLDTDNDLLVTTTISAQPLDRSPISVDAFSV
jgi:hypothetical protein